MMISSVVSRLTILSFGTLYPAYASFKAVRAKNVSAYIKWMMYWIVFAIFSCVETFTDLLLPWFPFYYEFKVVIVLWLLSPATNGSSFLYRKFVHPLLKSKESEIDGFIVRLRQQSYATIIEVLTQIVYSARTFVMDIVQRHYPPNGPLGVQDVRSSVSDGSINQQRHIFNANIEMIRSTALHFKQNPAEILIIEDESMFEDSITSENVTEPVVQQQPAANKRTKTVSKPNGKTAALRRGRGRKVKEEARDSATEDEI